MLAKEALNLLGESITTAVTNGKDVTARSNMLLGSMLAGASFGNSPVAGVHALAYPIGGTFHVPHLDMSPVECLDVQNKFTKVQ